MTSLEVVSFRTNARDWRLWVSRMDTCARTCTDAHMHTDIHSFGNWCHTHRHCGDNVAVDHVCVILGAAGDVQPGP